MRGITQAQLVSELRSLGYALEERTIEEWRQKGLLPKLAVRGRGRGAGKEYFWEENDIIHQTKTICDFFTIDCQTETALLALWFMGFKIAPENFRNAFMSRYKKMMWPITNKIRSAHNIGDAISQITTPHIGQLSKQLKVKREDIDQGIMNLYELILAPNSELGEAGYFMKEDAIKFLNKFISPRIDQKYVDSINLEPLMYLYRETTTQESVLHLIGSAAGSEIEYVQNIWTNFWNFNYSSILSKFPYFSRPGKKFLPQQYLSVYFGRFCIPVLLFLLKIGGREKLDNSINEYINFLKLYNFEFLAKQLLNPTGADQKFISDFFGLGNKLKSIWGEMLFPPSNTTIFK